mgnify:CR=1 FL=1
MTHIFFNLFFYRHPKNVLDNSRINFFWHRLNRPLFFHPTEETWVLVAFLILEDWARVHAKYLSKLIPPMECLKVTNSHHGARQWLVIFVLFQYLIGTRSWCIFNFWNISWPWSIVIHFHVDLASIFNIHLSLSFEGSAIESGFPTRSFSTWNCGGHCHTGFIT